MYLLCPLKNINKKNERLLNPVLLFGTGLVGGEILKKINQSKLFTQRYMPYSWGKDELQKKEYTDIFAQYLSVTNDSSKQITIIWSAGKAGFAAIENEIEQEFVEFDRFVTALEEFSQKYKIKVHLYLMSSIGAFYEGVVDIKRTSKPKILRPYGVLKNNMEQRLFKNQFFKESYIEILRLSSVYGYINLKKRMGLIPTMIYNGLLNKETKIFGMMTTLRDYLWVGDIADYILKQLGADLGEVKEGYKIYHLSAGRSLSIYGVKHEIERSLGRPIYISCDLSASNSKDMSCSKEGLPHSWSGSDFYVNIEKIRATFF